MERDMSRHSLFISSFKTNMNFVKKLFILVCICLIYVNYILPQYRESYNAAVIDKVNRLKTIEGSKIVLIGDSNVAFGYDSSMIEESIGLPVVNMGLHGGLGNVFHEEMAKLNVKDGDIYIVCHSTFADDDEIRDASLAWLTLEDKYELWEILRVKDIVNMIKGFPVYLKKTLNLYALGSGNLSDGSVYSRDAFNEYGDVEILREEPIYEYEEELIPPTINDITINRLNVLNKYLEDRGATLLIAGYPIRNSNITASVQEYTTFQEELKKSLDCAVISNYADYMFDYHYFYDVDLHLNTAGVRIRTEQLISDIKRWEQRDVENKDASIEFDIYENIAGDVVFPHIADISEYLAAIKEGQDRYIIFVSTNFSRHSDVNLSDIFQEFGIKLEDESATNCLAIIDGRDIIHKEAREKINTSGIIDNGKLSYNVISAEYNTEDTSSIVLNGQEYIKDKCGMNIVVYSKESGRILDSASFNISSGTSLTRY